MFSHAGWRSCCVATQSATGKVQGRWRRRARLYARTGASSAHERGVFGSAADSGLLCKVQIVTVAIGDSDKHVVKLVFLLRLLRLVRVVMIIKVRQLECLSSPGHFLENVRVGVEVLADLAERWDHLYNMPAPRQLPSLALIKPYAGGPRVYVKSLADAHLLRCIAVPLSTGRQGCSSTGDIYVDILHSAAHLQGCVLPSHPAQPHGLPVVGRGQDTGHRKLLGSASRYERLMAIAVALCRQSGVLSLSPGLALNAASETIEQGCRVSPLGGCGWACDTYYLSHQLSVAVHNEHALPLSVCR